MEFLVNTTTLNSQSQPTITALPSGGFVVTWRDTSLSGGDDSVSSIKAQLFDAAGNKVGGEFLVNSTTAGEQFEPVITTLASGGFVISWSDRSDAVGNIRAQIFDAGGNRVGGEFLVNTGTSGQQSEPTITALPSGGFVVSFQSEMGGLGRFEISAQIFDAAGNKIGGELLVNTTTTRGQVDPTVTSLASGGFVVSWVDFSNEGGSIGDGDIKAQIFDAAGNKIGGEFLVKAAGGEQNQPVITGLASGGFVISWFDPSGGQGGEIKAQIRNAAGAVIADEIIVNGATLNTQTQPTITSLPSGGFLISWTDASGEGGDSSGTGIKAQLFDASGNKVGGEFLVNVSTFNGQSEPAVTVLASGEIVVTWTDASGDGSGSGIRAIILSTGDARGGFIAGTPGDDTLVGTRADDHIVGGAGNDRLFGQDGNDLIGGQDGNDFIDGGNGRDTLYGDAGADHIVGGADNDVIFGQDGNDLIGGQDGLDFIDGGNGQDTLYGDAGEDHIIGGADNDAIFGQDDNDLIGGQDGDDFIDGGRGRDTLYGDIGRDHIVGGADGDAIFGQDGDDLVGGQDGDDFIDGGNGADVLYGDAGGDHIVGGAGNDAIFGQDGNDLIGGQDGFDFIDGGNGADVLFGDAGEDHIVGGADNDQLYGQGDNDLMGGQDGDDYMDGGAGFDTLYGDAGNDTLVGREGADNLFGQGGADRFVFTATTDSPGGGGIFDRIFDFDRTAGDLIDLSAVDANTATAENDAFIFIGTNSFSGRAGELRFGMIGNEAFVLGDTNGDGVEDIVFAVNVPVVATDFVL